MATIESEIADALAASLDSGETAPTSVGFVSLHGSGDVGGMHSSSSTTPMIFGLNAGAATRPMQAGFLTVDDTDHARHVAEAKAVFAASDLSLRLFRDASAPTGTVPGLSPPLKGRPNDR